MPVIVGSPPIIDELRQKFRIREGTIFSYGPIIYNPDGIEIPPSLFVHEAVHAKQQGSSNESILAWWARYIAEEEFRLAQEVPAHIAEFEWWRRNGNRNQRRIHLKWIAKRLASPLYGRIISERDAREILKSAKRA